MPGLRDILYYKILKRYSHTLLTTTNILLEKVACTACIYDIPFGNTIWFNFFINNPLCFSLNVKTKCTFGNDLFFCVQLQRGLAMHFKSIFVCHLSWCVFGIYLTGLGITCNFYSIYLRQNRGRTQSLLDDFSNILHSIWFFTFIAMLRHRVFLCNL